MGRNAQWLVRRQRWTGLWYAMLSPSSFDLQVLSFGLLHHSHLLRKTTSSRRKVPSCGTLRDPGRERSLLRESGPQPVHRIPGQVTSRRTYPRHWNLGCRPRCGLEAVGTIACRYIHAERGERGRAARCALVRLKIHRGKPCVTAPRILPGVFWKRSKPSWGWATAGRGFLAWD